MIEKIIGMSEKDVKKLAEEFVNKEHPDWGWTAKADLRDFLLRFIADYIAY